MKCHLLPGGRHRANHRLRSGKPRLHVLRTLFICLSTCGWGQFAPFRQSRNCHFSSCLGTFCARSLFSNSQALSSSLGCPAKSASASPKHPGTWLRHPAIASSLFVSRPSKASRQLRMSCGKFAAYIKEYLPSRCVKNTQTPACVMSGANMEGAMAITEQQVIEAIEQGIVAANRKYEGWTNVRFPRSSLP